MSEFKEMVKSFAKIREYTRDFFVYGFKAREDFQNKSTRTYDNERRRIESWLGKFVRQDYANNKKNISLIMDSNLLDTNPLYRVWKTKSFTDNDIMLHFYLLDYLDESDGQTAEEITDGLLDTYGIIFDSQLVRRKCNEYEKEGLLQKSKRQKQMIYQKLPSFDKLFSDFSAMADSLCFFQIASPLGIVGDTILDNIEKENSIFRVKHGFFVHTLEDEVLLDLLAAMHQKRLITIQVKSSKGSHSQYNTGVPLRIFTSTRTGRRYLCIYNKDSKRFFCIRMDYIKKVTLLDMYPDYDKIRTQLANNQPKAWGVSFQNETALHLHYLKMTLYIDELQEKYVLNRLYREGKGGQVTRIAENTFTYETSVFDANEMIPWIRSFICRIKKLESDHPKLNHLFERDMQAMYKMYDIT